MAMKLADYLRAHDMRPTEFASQGGWPSSTVIRWMNGTRQPRLDAVAKIQELTGGAVTAEDFLTVVASPPPFPATGDVA
jgi:predicted transcriptional regulator